MRIIWDATGETMYPVAHDGGLRGERPLVTSGSVVMIREISRRLAERGHTVHVVAGDLQGDEEQRGPTLWYWGPHNHPLGADVVVMTHQLSLETDYSADRLALAHTGCTPELGPSGEWGDKVDLWPVFSETHRRLLTQHNPTIPADRVFVTGLGVDLDDYRQAMQWMPEATEFQSLECNKVPGRMLYGNDPQRGLPETLDVFDVVRRYVPEASLHICYDFDSQLELHRWEQSYSAQRLLECKERIAKTPGVVSRGRLSREEVVREQLEASVHCYPSDPPGVGTQTHGLFQLECAAAGAALVLSDVEAFPEVFGGAGSGSPEASTILPVIGKYSQGDARRVTAEDYADRVVSLMRDPEEWRAQSQRARALAERLTWDRVVDAWERMLGIGGGLVLTGGDRG